MNKNYLSSYAELALPKYTYNLSLRCFITFDKITVSVSLPKFITTKYDSCLGKDLKKKNNIKRLISIYVKN